MLTLVPQRVATMPRNPTPKVGDTVNGWRILERLADEVRTDQYRKRAPRFRVRCANCTKELELRASDLAQRRCTDCLRAAQSVPDTATGEAEFIAQVQYAYRVRLRICLALGVEPQAYDAFLSYYREHPEDLLEESPVKRAADYEQRDYSPLYQASE